MIENIYYFTLFSIITISIWAFISKRGIHVLCLIVVYSYVSFLFLYNSGMPPTEYLMWDIIKLASISVILLLISCKSHSAKSYFFYSIIVLFQLIVNSMAIVGALTYKSLDNISLVLAVLELTVFFNGINRTFNTNNGRESGGIFAGFIGNFSYRYRYRTNSSHNAIQKGSQR